MCNEWIRSEKELETLNKKLNSELEEKTTAAAKLSDQLQCTETELNQLRAENAKVSIVRSFSYSWLKLQCNSCMLRFWADCLKM